MSKTWYELKTSSFLTGSSGERAVKMGWNKEAETKAVARRENVQDCLKGYIGIKSEDLLDIHS